MTAYPDGRGEPQTRLRFDRLRRILQRIRLGPVSYTHLAEAASLLFPLRVGDPLHIVNARQQFPEFAAEQEGVLQFLSLIHI